MRPRWFLHAVTDKNLIATDVLVDILPYLEPKEFLNLCSTSVSFELSCAELIGS